MIRFGRTEKDICFARGKMHDYLQLYIGKQEDLKVRWAPVLAEDLTTCRKRWCWWKFDRLEMRADYAKRLKEARK